MKKRNRRKASVPVTKDVLVERENFLTFMGLILMWCITLTGGIFAAIAVYDHWIVYCGFARAMFQAVGTLFFYSVGTILLTSIAILDSNW